MLANPMNDSEPAFHRSGFLYATAGMYLVAAVLYFAGFASIEGESKLWSVFALAGAAVLLQAARLAPSGWLFRVMVVVLLAIGAFANWIPIHLFFLIEAGSDYVVGYLGNSTRCYAWPHVAILILSVLAVGQILIAPRSRRMEIPVSDDEGRAVILHKPIDKGRALVVFTTGISLGWLALNLMESGIWFALAMMALPCAAYLTMCGLRLADAPG